MKTILFILALFFTLELHAVTYNVTNGNDSGTGSLREAIMLANASTSTDIIDVSNSVFIISLSTTTGSFSVANLPDLQDITLNGNGVVILTTIDTFFSTIRENVVINDVNFSGFRYNCLTIIPIDGGIISLNNCFFSDCTNFLSLLPGGGAIQQWDGVLNINSCGFSNCMASQGGAIFVRQISDDTILNACSFNDNIATSSGNAIYIESVNDLKLSGAMDFKTGPDQDVFRAAPEGGFPSPTVTLLPSFSNVAGSTLIIN